jgi:CHASE2 domain-containing sensor protein
LRRTTRTHWLIAVLLALAGLVAGEYPWLTSVRLRAYHILEKAIRRPSADIVVVLIGDEEYGGPRLQNRKPLHRDYLADLLTKIREGNPRAIAIDVDLSSPDAARPVIQPDYLKETNQFFDALRNAASEDCPIFLSAAIRPDAKRNTYQRLANIFDGTSLGDHVYTGYILLPADIRNIPPLVEISDGTTMRSIVARMAEVTQHHRVSIPTAEQVSFGVFRAPESFEQYAAGKVLEARVDDLKKWFAHQYVLIGGDWTADNVTGAHIDHHMTPAGDIAGVFVHANYLQSLIGGPIGALGELTRAAIELGTALSFSILFVAARGWWKLVFLLLVNLGLIVLTYLFLDVLGVFFEAVVPITLLGGHAIIETMLEKESHHA